MSSRKRRGLGQGLGALIPGGGGEPEPTREPDEGTDASPSPSGLREVPIDSILKNPYQPRTMMEEEKLGELADSIREHGIIQPLIVTQIEDGAVGERFRLIAGERRWRAAKRVGLTQVPVVVKEATERQMLELALIENIQRADLNPIEEAMAYQQMAEFSGLTQEEIAERVGKKRTTVSNMIRLLRLPEPIQELVRAGALSEGHARTLLSLANASQMLEAATHFIEGGLTVRQAEEWVKRGPSSAEPSESVASLSLHDRDLQQQFVRSLGTQVELRRRKKGGQLIIHFADDEDLQALYSLLVQE